jgi:hypothetical protein
MTATIEQEIDSRMNTMSPLGAIVEKLEYHNKIKEDRVVPSGHVRYDPGSGLLLVGASSIEESGYNLTDVAHDQISEKLGIPRSYYQKMKTEYPQLLGDNINGWLGKKEKTKYLLRTFDYKENGIQNTCRAMLSNRYNILDNYDVLIAALEAIQKTGIDVEIVKADITDRRMYLHIIAPEIHHKATELLDGYLSGSQKMKLNEGIVSGILLTNSEVGMGTFEIAAASQIVVCSNKLVDRNAKFRKVHLGGRLNEGIIQWSENTKNKNYELIMAQVGDSVKEYLSERYLGNLVSKLTGYKKIEIEHPTGVIEKLGKELQLAESHKVSVLKHFLKDGDSSVFGMMNAVTRTSQDMGADEQHDIEASIFDLLPRIKTFDKLPQSKN